MVEDSNVENEVNDVPIILENELAQQSEEGLLDFCNSENNLKKINNR